MKTGDILIIDGITELSPVISSEISGVYCGEFPCAARNNYFQYCFAGI